MRILMWDVHGGYTDFWSPVRMTTFSCHEILGAARTMRTLAARRVRPVAGARTVRSSPPVTRTR